MNFLKDKAHKIKKDFQSQFHRPNTNFYESVFFFFCYAQLQHMTRRFHSSTSHFSLSFTTCLVSIGFRIRIFTSNLPPTVFRPSINWKFKWNRREVKQKKVDHFKLLTSNESWISHVVSNGCSLTTAVPINVSDRRNANGNPLKQHKFVLHVHGKRWLTEQHEHLLMTTLNIFDLWFFGFSFK